MLSSRFNTHAACFNKCLPVFIYRWWFQIIKHEHCPSWLAGNSNLSAFLTIINHKVILFQRWVLWKWNCSQGIAICVLMLAVYCLHLKVIWSIGKGSEIFFFFFLKCVLLVFKKQIITWIKTSNWGEKNKEKRKKAAAYVNRQTGLAPGHSESAESVRVKIQGTSEAHRRQLHEQADRTAVQSLRGVRNLSRVFPFVWFLHESILCMHSYMKIINLKCAWISQGEDSGDVWSPPPTTPRTSRPDGRSVPQGGQKSFESIPICLISTWKHIMYALTWNVLN